MNTNDIKWKLKKFGLKVWNKKEDIAFVTGTVGTAVGTYLFVKAAKKNEPVIDEYKKKKEAIDSDENMTPEEKNEATKHNTISVIKGSGKNYAIPIAVSGASYGLQIYAVVRKNSELKNISTALTTSLAAYEALKQTIISEEGEEKWKQYAYGDKIKQYTEIDSETGEAREMVEMELGTSGIDFSFPYDGRLDQNGMPMVTTYQDAQGANKTYLCILENSWEDKLQRSGKDGWIFLRPVWESVFGNLNQFPKEWSNAGWPAVNADGTTNHITFGIRPVGSRENDPAINAFWDEKTNDVRITFEGLVPDLYKTL